ncbi:ABC transporter substrate-binding protein [Aquisalimonas asiatica]|uniref:Amino acid/amide ABC transporter substrate-binding protein, HAAT family (TC 3.A.1.4.-) n=1 Tax=Aquisalimonas asiatica TaxID=406100 RepID=A0A1H8TDJ8_9GAMM|nr:ABC transporter substrate-binding protein [Aquisalimonas asiatica]SEO88664.1 amino acid/amide ABC transporter substrate-binding protein, HAAT family (TC 3.A.1.4.-) [Aquisalimonas asiatica]
MTPGLQRGRWLALLLLVPALAQAELRFGIVAPFSGGAAGLGEGMRTGIETHFEEINAAGGVNGRQLELISRDDGYEPSRSAPLTREIIEEDDVLAAIGNVGTPTAIVTIPIHNRSETLLFGAFTGAGVLRQDPPDRYVINFRASYHQETAAMIDGLLEAGVEPDEIAFFTQNDGFGDAGHSGAMAALEAHDVNRPEALAHGRYTRGTTNIHHGLATILEAETEPRAIIMVGVHGPIAEFVEEAYWDLPDTVFLAVSFVGSHALRDALDPEMAESVVITQVVPPYDADLPAVEDYREALAAHAPDTDPNFISLEGYLAARTFVAGLEEAGDNPGREDIVDGLLSLGEFDIGLGETLSLGPDDHQASDSVWPTRIRDGEFEPLDWSELFD